MCTPHRRQEIRAKASLRLCMPKYYLINKHFAVICRHNGVTVRQYFVLDNGIPQIWMERGGGGGQRSILLS